MTASAAAFDPSMAVALMSAAADPKAFQDRMAKLQAGVAEYKKVKAEALKLKAESEAVAKATAASMAELATARTEHGETVTKAEQALMMRIQAADDREKDLALWEEALKTGQSKLVKDVNDHARYRERDGQAHQLKLGEIVRREGLVTERETAADAREGELNKRDALMAMWLSECPVGATPQKGGK